MTAASTSPVPAEPALAWVTQVDERYLPLEHLGEGGMGVVARAYDTRLRREVALKRLADHRREHAAARRLATEARAMAKLSHPNVVTIYGVHDIAPGELVIAMEFVPGNTLRNWGRKQTRTVEEIVDVFSRAGRGLSAAHAANLLHRDFKPANVLVSADGATVKVTDFGIVSALGEDPTTAWSGFHEETSQPQRLTRTGRVMGTPRYMAPEQRRGASLTPAADQYAFCVALWEALCGEPPAGANSSRTRRSEPPPWPKNVASPRLGEVVRRGLALSPSRRWPSMQALVEALDERRARSETPQRVVAALAGVGVVLAAGIGVRGNAPSACSGAASKVESVWTQSRREAMRDAMLGVDKTFAIVVHRDTQLQIDNYAADWVDTYRTSCEANKREPRTIPVDASMRCLDRALRRLDGAINQLTTSDVATIARAHRITADFPSLSRCLDAASLAESDAPPLPGQANAVRAARSSLAAFDVALAGGDFDEAGLQLQGAQRESRDVSYPRLFAELKLARAKLLRATGSYDQAIESARGSAALFSSLHDRTGLFDANHELAWLAGHFLRRPRVGRAYVSVAARAAAPQPRSTIAIATLQSAIAEAEGSYAQSEVYARRALEMSVEVNGPNAPVTALAMLRVGNALQFQGRFPEAEEFHRSAAASSSASLGDSHPTVALHRNNLANALKAQDKLSAAAQEYRAAIEIWTDALGSNNVDVAAAQTNLGDTLLRQGHAQDAEKMHRLAVQTWSNTLGDDHPDTAGARSNLGITLVKSGMLDEGEAQLRLALSSRIENLPADHPDIGASLSALGALLYERERFVEAESFTRRALPIKIRALGAGHPSVANTRANLGLIAHELGRSDEAVDQLERAVSTFRSALGAEHAAVSINRRNIAIVLAATGHTRRAKAILDEVLLVQERSQGADHPDVMETREQLRALSRPR